MPANRNDITHKPIMTTAPTKEKWTYYSRMGKAHVVWANSLEEAEAHAKEQGWTLHEPEKETNDDEDNS